MFNSTVTKAASSFLVFGFLQIRSGICSGQPHILKNVVPKQLALCFIFRNLHFLSLLFFQITVGARINLFSGPFFC